MRRLPASDEALNTLRPQTRLPEGHGASCGVGKRSIRRRAPRIGAGLAGQLLKLRPSGFFHPFGDTARRRHSAGTIHWHQPAGSALPAEHRSRLVLSARSVIHVQEDHL